MTRSLDINSFPLFGTQFIEASAGTGKTYTLIALVMKMIVERGVPIESIVVVTFTVAATEELKERLLLSLEELVSSLHLSADSGRRKSVQKKYSRVSPQVLEERALQALRNIDRAAIFTIHGFAGRVLQEFSLEAGVESNQPLIDRSALTQEIAEDYFSGSVATLPTEYLKLLGGSKILTELREVLSQIQGLQQPELVRPISKHDQAQALLLKLQEFKALAQRCHERLSLEAHDLVRELSLSKELNGKSYSPKSLSKEYQGLLAVLADEELDIGSVRLNLFTSEKFLHSRTKAGLANDAQPPEIFSICDQLQAELVDLLDEVDIAKSCLLYEAVSFVLETRTSQEESLGVQSFDTLLLDLLSSLKTRGEPLKQAIRQRYQVALIDEFQDTDEVQYEIFRRLFVDKKNFNHPTSTLMLIGDPKQAIYSFRGADIHTYLRAAHDAHEGQFSLTTNYRSSPSVIMVLNAFFGLSQSPFRLQELSYEPVLPRPEALPRLFDEEGNCAAGLEVLKLEGLTGANKLSGNALGCAVKDLAWRLTSEFRLEGAPLSPKHFAILLPTNSKVQAAAAALREFDIPCVLHSSASVYHSAEAGDLIEILKALLNPTQLPQLKRALLTPLFRVDMAQIAEFDAQGLEPKRAGQLNEKGEERPEFESLNDYLEKFVRWSRLWSDFGLARVLSELVESGAQHIVLRNGGERSLTNYRHLMELLEEQARKERLGRSEVLRFLEFSSAQEQSLGDDSTQLRLDTDEDAVTLMTYHKSKGLEFEIVYAVELGVNKTKDKRLGVVSERIETENAEGDMEARHRVHFLHPLPEELLENHEELQRQERLRVAYVALTRAKEQVITCYVPEDKKQGVLSDWLMDSEEQELDWTRLQAALPPESAHHFKIRLNLDLLEKSELKARVLKQLSRRKSLSLSQHILKPIRRPFMRTSSFSQMTKKTGHYDGHTTALGRELDEPLAAEAGAQQAKSHGRVSLFSEFERGAKAGDALHQVLEEIPFSSLEYAQRQSVGKDILTQRGYSEETSLGALAGLEEVLKAPLNGQGALCLASLAPENRIAEMEFQFPVGDLKVPGTALSAESLGKALAEGIIFDPLILQASTPEVRDKLQGYGESIKELEFEEFQGFLRGFIDLTYQADGRYFILDYKSNDMGTYYDDYHPAQLAASMLEHHYLLQAAIYTLALHRFLRLRLKGYDYDYHVGGSRYAYLRGMHSEEPERGVFAFSFTRRCIENLDALFFLSPVVSVAQEAPQWLQQVHESQSKVSE